MSEHLGLKDLLKEQMRDLYDAEVHYAKKLPRLIDTLTAPDLVTLLQKIAVQTDENTTRLAQICDLLGVPPTGITCHAMDGLLREATDTAKGWANTAAIDAALIANAQRIVHYEIAGFGTGRAFASILGEKEAAHLLQAMLTQSIDNDKALTHIAIGGWFTAGVNADALKPEV